LAAQLGVSPKHAALVYVACTLSNGVPSASADAASPSCLLFDTTNPTLCMLSFPQFVEALLRCASLSAVKVTCVHPSAAVTWYGTLRLRGCPLCVSLSVVSARPSGAHQGHAAVLAAPAVTEARQRDRDVASSQGVCSMPGVSLRLYRRLIT
jgi:hypothetical protein